MARLDSLCTMNMGQSPDSASYNETGAGIPFFQGNADFGETNPQIRVWCSAPTKIAHAGDILISVRAPIGALNIANTECCIGRGLAALTVNEVICVKGYLWHAIATKVDELNAKGTGSTFKAISKSILAETEIPLPPIDQQQKIVDTLDNVIWLISNRKEQLEKLEEIVKSHFIEMFGDPVMNPLGWIVVQLNEITSKIGSGATPLGGNAFYIDRGISLIRSMNVYNRVFMYEDLAHINDEQARLLNGVKVSKNDVLINITGASVARSCIVPDDVLPARVNQHVSILRCKNALNYRFLNALLTSDSYQRELLSMGYAGGATRQAITKKQLENLSIILPPFDMQEHFATFVQQIDKSKSKIQSSLVKLETLKKALMQKYFG